MHPKEIRIAAPSLTAAIALRRDLAGFGPAFVGLRHGWTVEFDVPGARLDELRAVLRDWLREIREPSTVLIVDRVPEAVAVDLPALVPRARVRRGNGAVLAATARRRGEKPQRESGTRPIPKRY
jgi:hypothetical protein